MNVTKQLYQWDTGQKLTECTGIYVDYLIGDEVYRVEITDGTCIIPDELLQTSGRYKVWECMADNTLREFAFKVLPRPVPPNYVFTPTEQLTFEGLVQKETNKFNTNAIEKLNAYNANADNRVAEFNAQTEQIQTDVSELKSDLTEYKHGYEYMPIINGQYVNGSTGVFHNDPNWSRTDYIDCSEYNELEFENNTKASLYCCFYNENKEFVSNLNLSQIGKNIIVVPSGAKYFVLSNITSNLNDVMFRSKLDLDLEIISSKIGNETNIEFVFEDGYYIDSSTGEKKADSSWKCSDMVELPINAKKLIITSSGQSTNNIYNAFYNSDGIRTGRINILANTKKQVFVIPNNAKYFSVSIVKSSTISVKADIFGINELNNSVVEYDNNKFIVQRNALNTINSISRMGLSNGGYPKESIFAFKEAIKQGCNAIRCNCRFTSDGVPVSLHDDTINAQNARLIDGSKITTPIDVSSVTLDSINSTYNFSTSGSNIYNITKFEDVVSLCKKLGETVYVEMKIVPNNTQCDTLIRIVKRYGMEKNVVFIGYNETAIDAIQYIIDNSNVTKVGIMQDSLDVQKIVNIGALNSNNVEVFIWGWNTFDLTDYIDALIENNVKLEVGTFDTESDIIAYFNTEINNYVTGIESNYFVASKVIIDSVIN